MDRLRWDNIARAAAVLAVIALVVAWPHLRGAPPDLPPAAAAPVATAEPAAPSSEPAPPLPSARVRQHRRHVARRPPPRVATRRPRPVSPPAVAAPPRPVVPAAPRSSAHAPPAPSASDQAAREFAVP